MVLIAGSANSEIAQIVKQENSYLNFYIGRNVVLFGHHIHHFYFGILFMCFAGWVAIVGIPRIKKEILALLYGIGLGLFMDEIGLLLTWGDYFSSLSYLLGVFLLGIFFNIIYFPDFWKKVRAGVNSGGYAVFKKIISFLDLVTDRVGKVKNRLTYQGVLFIIGLLIIIRLIIKYRIG